MSEQIDCCRRALNLGSFDLLDRSKVLLSYPERTPYTVLSVLEALNQSKLSSLLTA